MKHPKSNRTNLSRHLLTAYEAMSQKGKVQFLEETVFFDLIDHYQCEQQPGKILQVINHAIQQYPSTMEFYFAKARYYLQVDEVSLAKAVLKKALIYSPFDFGLHLMLAEIFGRMAQYPKAYKVLDYLKSITEGKDVAKIYVCEAVILQSEKRLAEQFNALKKALQIDPEADAALDQIWWSMECTGRYVETALLHEQILETNAFNAKAWLNAGKAYDAMGKTEDAIDAFEFALFLDDRLEMAYRDVVELLIDTKQYKRALTTLQEAVRLFSADALYCYQIAYCNEMLGERTIAKAFYLKALDFEKDLEEVFFRLGECYGKEKDWKTAIYFYNKAIALNDDNAAYFMSLEKAYHCTKDYDNADASFEKAVMIDPLSPDCWIQHILFQLDRGNTDLVFENLEAAHLNSGDEKLLYCHAICYYRTGDHNSALEQLGEALNADFGLFPCIFEMCPEMDFDDRVQALIELYRH